MTDRQSYSSLVYYHGCDSSGDLQGEEETFYLHSSVTRQLNLAQSVSHLELEEIAKLSGRSPRHIIGPRAGVVGVGLSPSGLNREATADATAPLAMSLVLIMTPFKGTAVSQPVTNEGKDPNYGQLIDTFSGWQSSPLRTTPRARIQENVDHMDVYIEMSLIGNYSTVM